MKVDSVITLENDVDCLLIEKETIDNKNYFLSVVLNENAEPTDESVVFEEIIEDGEIFVEKVTDPQLLAKLADLFTEALEKFVNGLE